MMVNRRLLRNQSGVATIEMAFALPVLIVIIWMFVQFAQMYRALSGIQQALGEGARYATLCLSPTTAGCTPPPPVTDVGTTKSVKTKIAESVYGIGPGTFDPPTVTTATSGSATYYDLTVKYSQPTDVLLFAGPTINITRSKRVWVAGN